MLDKHDPFSYMKSAKAMKIEQPKQRKHEEANLHLAYVSWLRKQYPKADFVRHEKERSRSHFLGGLMQKYNSLDGLPDFELLEPCWWEHGMLKCGLYIEFKKPGEKWLEKTGHVKKAYQHQYECHVKLWAKGYCVYFCNDLDEAIKITNAYMTSFPLPQQIYEVHKLGSDVNLLR